MKRNTQLTTGSNQGTGVPQKALTFDGKGNTSNPSGAHEPVYMTNGSTGSNNSASSTTDSGSSMGNALMQLYQTKEPIAFNEVQNPTLSGGQFPPGAPSVSGTEKLIGPSLGNSQGNAASDSISRLNYAASFPSSTGASVNGLAEGPVQSGGMPQLGSILQGISSPTKRLNQQPQPPYNLAQIWPNSVGNGGLT